MNTFNGFKSSVKIPWQKRIATRWQLNSLSKCVLNYLIEPENYTLSGKICAYAILTWNIICVNYIQEMVLDFYFFSLIF